MGVLDTEIHSEIDKTWEMNESQRNIFEQLTELCKNENLPNPPNVRHIDKKRVEEASSKVNEVISRIATHNITHTNRLIKAGATISAKHLGVKESPNGRKNREPHWKRRIKRKTNKLRKDVSMIEEWKDGKLRKEIQEAKLNRLYSVKKKGFKRVAEELKQRIKATSATVKRYTERVKQYRQKRLFQTNQSKFYK